MTNEEKIKELVNLVEDIKNNLDTECCQTLMDADSMSAKIEEILKKINNQ